MTSKKAKTESSIKESSIKESSIKESSIKESSIKDGTPAPEGAPAKSNAARGAGRLEVQSSTLSYRGPLFNVHTDLVRGPGGHEYIRDVIRHNGSVVVLGIDDSKSRKDPLIILEKQYRHAAGQFLLEIPAGKLEPGEKPLAGAKRELLEETGYTARKWTRLVRYYASPGFLGESMQIFIAEGLTAGEARPEIDEFIEVRMVPLSEMLALIDAGKILDGKTIVSILMYSRRLASQRKK